MKKSIFITSFIAFLMVISGSDDEPITPISNSDTFLTAKVDGVDFEVRGNLFAVDSEIAGDSSTLMGASYDDESRTINMGITNLNSTGTYSLIDIAKDDPLTSKYASSIIYGEGSTGWYAIHYLRDVTATITISELNNSYVTGTFNFIGVDSKTEKSVTDGRFKFKRLNVKK